MGDGDDGPALQQSGQRFLDRLLRFRVEGGGRLIEENDGRIAQKGARDGKALALPAGELQAALADDGGESRRQGFDEFRAMGGLGGGIDLRIAGLGPTVAQILQHRAVKQGDVLLHHGDGAAQALLRHLGDVLLVDKHMAAVGIVEPLQQGQHRRFARARAPDQAELLPGPHMETEILQDPLAIRIAEADIDEGDRPAQVDERLGAWHILHFMGRAQHPHRLAQLGEMAQQLHHRHGEVARGMQHGEAEGRGQDHIPGGDAARPPEHDRPGEHGAGHDEDRDGVEQAQPLDGLQALALGGHLMGDLAGQPRLLALGGAEGAHQAHIAHHIGQIAAHRRGFAGIALMQMLAPAGKPTDDDREANDDGEQHQGHRPVDEAEDGDAAENRGRRRNRGPCEGVLDNPGGFGGRGDAGGERPRELVGKIARAMPGQMIEELEAKRAAGGDEDIARDPPGKPPHQMVAGNEAEQQSHRPPELPRGGMMQVQHVNQILDAILRGDGAADGQQHGKQDHKMAHQLPTHMVQQKAHRTAGSIAG